MRLRELLPLLLVLPLLAACPTPDDDDDDAGIECDALGGDEDPVVLIDEPDNALPVGLDESINWIVRVEDEDGDVTQVTLIAEDVSNVTPDPVDFDVPSPGADGRAVFAMPADVLESGVVTVRIRGIDEQGCTDDDQIFVCVDDPVDGLCD